MLKPAGTLMFGSDDPNRATPKSWVPACFSMRNE
jgi:hypothetical protein